METSLLAIFEEIPCTIVHDLLHITITVCVAIANAITLSLPVSAHCHQYKKTPEQHQPLLQVPHLMVCTYTCTCTCHYGFMVNKSITGLYYYYLVQHHRSDTPSKHLWPLQGRLLNSQPSQDPMVKFITTKDPAPHYYRRLTFILRSAISLLTAGNDVDDNNSVSSIVSPILDTLLTKPSTN